MSKPVFEIFPFGGFFRGRIGIVPVPQERPGNLIGKLREATGRLNPVYHRNGGVYTDGTVLEFRDAQKLVVAVDEKPGDEWIQVSHDVGIISTSASPRLAASGTHGGKWQGCRLDQVWVHRDDVLGIELEDAGYSSLKGYIRIESKSFGDAYKLIQAGKLAPRIQFPRGQDTHFFILPKTELSLQEWAEIGYFSLVPEGTTSDAVTRNCGYRGDSFGLQIPPSVREATDMGITIVPAECEVSKAGQVFTRCFTIDNPGLAARQFNMPWLQQMPSGCHGMTGRGSSDNKCITVAVPLGEMNSGRIFFSGQEFLLVGSGNTEAIQIALKNVTLKGVPFVEIEKPVANACKRRFIAASREAAALNFMTLVEASRKAEVPAEACVLVLVAGENVERDTKYVLTSELAQWPKRGTSMREANARAKEITGRVLAKFGSMPKAFNPRIHTIEELETHLVIRERIDAGQIFRREEILAEVVGTPFIKLFETEIHNRELHPSVTDPVTKRAYFENRVVLAEELRRRPFELFEAIAAGSARWVAAVTQDEEAARQLQVSIIIGS